MTVGEPAGDFVALYEFHYPRLVRSLELAGATRSTAEDVAQEAFARTLQHWRRVRRGSSPAGYVFRVAFRLVRRRPSGVRLDGDESRVERGLGDRDEQGDVASFAALRSSVATAIDAMPRARRSCAILCIVVEMSPKEAGRALGIAESTVRKQVERARLDLQAALKD